MSKEIAKIGKQIERLQSMSLENKDIFKHIRWSDELNKGSVYDVVQTITGCAKNDTGKYWERIKLQQTEVLTKCQDFQFPGKGQRNTPIADTKTLIQIAFLCPGKNAYNIGAQAANALARQLAGDLSLVDELVKNNGSLDLKTQEKLLSGTNSTSEQANAVPETFKQISEGHIIFKQPMLYFGQYKELSGPNSVKFGQSKDIFQRIKGSDQAERMQWHKLLPMPNQKMLNQYEEALKMFAKEHNILAKKKEYIDPKKLGIKLGSLDSLEAQSAIDALMGIMSPQLEEGQNVITVCHTEIESPPPSYEEAVTQKKFQLGAVNSDECFKELPFYNELVESFKKCLAVVSKDKSRPVSEQIELSREETRRMELRNEAEKNKADFMMELIRMGKDVETIKVLMEIRDGPGYVQSYRKILPGTNKIEAFVSEYCVFGPDHRIQLTHLYGEYDNWCQRHGMRGVKKTKDGQTKYEKSLKERFRRCFGIRARDTSTGGAKMWIGVTLKDQVI